MALRYGAGLPLVPSTWMVAVRWMMSSMYLVAEMLGALAQVEGEVLVGLAVREGVP